MGSKLYVWKYVRWLLTVPAWLSLCLSLYLIFLSVCLSVSLSVFLAGCLSVFVCISVCLSVCLFSHACQTLSAILLLFADATLILNFSYPSINLDFLYGFSHLETSLILVDLYDLYGIDTSKVMKSKLLCTGKIICITFLGIWCQMNWTTV